jgi:hypothetical protein
MVQYTRCADPLWPIGQPQPPTVRDSSRRRWWGGCFRTGMLRRFSSSSMKSPPAPPRNGCGRSTPHCTLPARRCCARWKATLMLSMAWRFPRLGNNAQGVGPGYWPRAAHARRSLFQPCVKCLMRITSMVRHRPATMTGSTCPRGSILGLAGKGEMERPAKPLIER